MSINIISKTEQKTSKWSGGTTTELFIYPENSIYSDRNFDFRISSAKIEIKESEFTNLPNYKRLLMILKGDVEIEHKNILTKKLNNFEAHSFLGDWPTSSKGTAIDFNLIYNKKFNSQLKSIKIKKNESFILRNELKNFFQGFYLFKGLIKVNEHALSKSDFVHFTDNEVEINTIEDAIIILIEISKITE